MSDNYYLKIGGANVFSDQLIADLSSADPETKKKAEAVINERLKETRVRVGTLLKTDNVSFLIGAGASIKAGGVGLASIPPELEKTLHEKAQEAGNGQDPDWLLLFYETVSALSGHTLNLAGRRDTLGGDLSRVPKISINIEEYLSHLHIWRAGMHGFTANTTLNLAAGAPWLSLRR